MVNGGVGGARMEVRRPPALIINHMQQGIVGTGRFTGAPVEQQKAYLDSHPEIIGNQKKLLAAFREKGYPIVFISVIPDPIGYVPKWGFIFDMLRRCAPPGNPSNPDVAEMSVIPRARPPARGTAPRPYRYLPLHRVEPERIPAAPRGHRSRDYRLHRPLHRLQLGHPGHRHVLLGGRAAGLHRIARARRAAGRRRS